MATGAGFAVSEADRRRFGSSFQCHLYDPASPSQRPLPWISDVVPEVQEYLGRLNRKPTQGSGYDASSASGCLAPLAAAVGKVVIFWTNTGAGGGLKSASLTSDDRDPFHAGPVMAHHVGVGSVFPKFIVRAEMAIRVNSVLGRNAGCSPDFVTKLTAILNAGATPVVRRMRLIGRADIGLMSKAKRRLNEMSAIRAAQSVRCRDDATKNLRVWCGHSAWT